VKAWMTLPAVTSDDGPLGMLISQISRNIISHINRSSLLPKTFTDTFNGNNKSAQMLKYYPVNSITSVMVDGSAVPAAPSVTSSGYSFEATDPEPPGNRQSVFLSGYAFNRGLQNVSISYVAGYMINAEPVVAAAAVTVQQPYGAWGSAVSVTNAATGVAFVKVTTAPLAGQYQISTTVPGGYVFNASDAGTALLISYGYIPADLANAALEWIAERWAYRQRVGVSTKTLGGQETASFAISKMPSYIAEILQQFTAVATL
jgi:hypothetical protein